MLGLLARPTLGCPTSDLRHFCPHVNGPNKGAAREEKEEEEEKKPSRLLHPQPAKKISARTKLFVLCWICEKSSNCRNSLKVLKVTLHVWSLWTTYRAGGPRFKAELAQRNPKAHKSFPGLIFSRQDNFYVLGIANFYLESPFLKLDPSSTRA